MATDKTTRAKPAGPSDKGLRIVSRPASFWRCGRNFTGEAVIIPLSELSPEEVVRLRDEPNLVVTEVDIEPAKA